jgi:tetratricopeptide (TPR) repeat protein
MVARSLRWPDASNGVVWGGLTTVLRVVAALTGSARWRFRVGRAFEQRGDLERAREAYVRATSARRARPEWHLSLARVLEQQRRWADAAASYRTALAAQPHRHEERLPLAIALRRAGDRAGASEVLRDHLASMPDADTATLYDLGAELERCGDHAAALEVYLRLEEGGAAPTAKLAARLAKAFRQLGSLDAAERRVVAGLRLAPDHVGLRREHAELASDVNDWGVAVERWERALEVSDDAATYAKLIHAQRSLGDLEAALRTVTAARSRWPGDLRICAEEARAATAAYQEVGEDERHAWKERLVTLERELSSREDEVMAAAALGRALGNVRLALRDWEGAIRTWARLEAAFPGLRAEACLKQARALRSVGREVFARAALPADDPARLELSRAEEHFVQATDALERARTGGELPDRHAVEANRLATQYGRWAASHAATVAQLRFQAGELALASSALEGALALRGYGDLTPFAPILQRLTALGAVGHPVPADLGGPGTRSDEAVPTVAVAPPAVAVPSEGQPPPTVLVSGFLYSGSGAAYDYLRQYERAAEPFGSHELWVLKKLNNFGTLLQPDVARVETFVDAVIASILTNIFGFGQMGHPIAVYYEEPPADIAELADLVVPFLDGLRLAVDDAVRTGAAVAPAGVELELRRLFARLLERFTPPGQLALLNNAVPAFQLVDHLDLFPAARAVVVLREPGDQYVSQRMESPYPRDHESFVAMMEDRYRSFAAVRSSTDRARVLPVSFERFVTDAALRRQVASWVGLGHDEPANTGSSFDPARSRRNVGIHAAYARQDEVRFVQERLVPQLAALFEDIGDEVLAPTPAR